MEVIYICIGSACHLKGSYHVINRLQEIIKNKKLEDKVQIKGAFCLGQCTKGVSVRINNGPIQSVDEKRVDEFFEEFVMGRL